MAKNRFLSHKTVSDIDKRVERVLRGLGDPEPPLRLEDVRELLNLDRKFYTANDPGVVREVISRMRVAGIRWNEGHEIGHSIIPWHQDIMLGDNALTLYPDCQEQVEAEANHAAGRLLFLRERFTEELCSGRAIHRNH